MKRGNSARLLPMIMTVVVIVLVIVAIVSIGRAIFGGSATDTRTEPEVDRGRAALLEVKPNHSVRLTVRGPIVADENFKSYQVTVSPSKRVMNVYKGYLEKVEKSKELDNNMDAYEQFAYALDKANMMKGDELDDEKLDDLRGICATGYVYEYDVLVENKSVKHLWSSTCGGSKGSLDASVEQLNNLFHEQIPGSEDLIPFNTSGLRLKF